MAHSIGRWNSVDGKHYGLHAYTIVDRAARQNLKGVVWTNLPCGFRNSRSDAYRGSCSGIPGCLKGEALLAARRDIANTSAQIETKFRPSLTAYLQLSAELAASR